MESFAPQASDHLFWDQQKKAEFLVLSGSALLADMTS